MVGLGGINQEFRLGSRWTHDDLALLVHDFLLRQHGVAEPEALAGDIDFLERVWFSPVEALRPKRLGKPGRAIGQNFPNHFG